MNINRLKIFSFFSRLDRSVNPIFGYPNLVRFSWSTTKEALNRNGAVVVKWFEILELNIFDF